MIQAPDYLVKTLRLISFVSLGHPVRHDVVVHGHAVEGNPPVGSHPCPVPGE
jgi:hypothetical protein